MSSSSCGDCYHYETLVPRLDEKIDSLKSQLQASKQENARLSALLRIETVQHDSWKKRCLEIIQSHAEAGNIENYNHLSDMLEALNGGV